MSELTMRGTYSCLEIFNTLLVFPRSSQTFSQCFSHSSCLLSLVRAGKTESNKYSALLVQVDASLFSAQEQ